MGKMEYVDDLVAWEEGFEFYYPVKVRFSETDLFGHLNNTVPFIYFEQARIEFFKSKGFFHNWLSKDSDTIPIVADLQCDFLKQVYFDEDLRVYVKVNEIGNSSADLHYMVEKENDEICLAGRGAIVQLSKKTGKGVPWPEDIRDLFIESPAQLFK